MLFYLCTAYEFITLVYYIHTLQVIAILDRIKDEKSKFQSDEELCSSIEQDGDREEEDQDEGIIYVD